VYNKNHKCRLCGKEQDFLTANLCDDCMAGWISLIVLVAIYRPKSMRLSPKESRIAERILRGIDL